MQGERTQRRTRQREVILEELRNLRTHPTAADLYEIVRRRLPKISLSTVYRNLERLASLGKIRRLVFSGAETRFDGNVRRHDHVRCVGCGRVDDAELPPLELSSPKQHDLGGYQILDYRLEFLGLCPECRARADRVGKGQSPQEQLPSEDAQRHSPPE